MTGVCEAPTCKCECHGVALVVGSVLPMHGPRPARRRYSAGSRFWVYQLTDAAGAVIYVGQTSNPLSRRADHGGKFPAAMAMTLVECHPTRADALAAELAMINALRPPGNPMEFDRHPYHLPPRVRPARLLTAAELRARREFEAAAEAADAALIDRINA